MKSALKKELTIGALVIVALAVLFIGIDFLKGINVFKAANYYYVQYTNVLPFLHLSTLTASRWDRCVI